MRQALEAQDSTLSRGCVGILVLILVLILVVIGVRIVVCIFVGLDALDLKHNHSRVLLPFLVDEPVDFCNLVHTCYFPSTTKSLNGPWGSVLMWCPYRSLMGLPALHQQISCTWDGSTSPQR